MPHTQTTSFSYLSYLFLCKDLISISRNSQSILLMEELTPYIESPQDENIATAFHDATLAWDAVSLQKRRKKKRLGLLSLHQPFDIYKFCFEHIASVLRAEEEVI